jgi:hypothetical protein
VIRRKDEKTQARPLYSAFCKWCEEVNEEILSEQEFSTKMQNKKGIEKKRINGSYFYKNIKLIKG